MKLVRRVLSRNRIKAARQTLAEDASPRTYAALAKEYAMIGSTQEVRRVCQEGLKAFPGNAELSRMVERASRLEREERYAELKRELEQAPRPALWREMCQIMIESGRLKRAEEIADRWIESKDDLDSRLMLARVRHERFLADRARAQGQSAAKALDDAIKLGPADSRTWRLKLEFLMKVGAWKDARQVVAQLLQLEPGSPDLEGRFRTLDARADESPSLERALLEVERTGRLADDEQRSGTVAGSAVRPILRRLASEPRRARGALHPRLHGPDPGAQGCHGRADRAQHPDDPRGQPLDGPPPRAGEHPAGSVGGGLRNPLDRARRAGCRRDLERWGTGASTRGGPAGFGGPQR